MFKRIIIKKIVVAVISFGTSGVIIAGGMHYGHRPHHGHYGCSETVSDSYYETGDYETETESTTEYIKETDVEDVTEESTEENKEITIDDDLNIDKKLDGVNEGIIVDENENIDYKLVIPERVEGVRGAFEEFDEDGEVEIGDYVFMKGEEKEYTEDRTYWNVKFRDKDDDKVYEIPYLERYQFVSNTYTNGEILYYCFDGKLFKYYLDEKKCEYIIPDYECDDTLKIKAIVSGNILMDLDPNCAMLKADDKFNTLMCIYDIRGGDIQVANDREGIQVLDDEYFIAYSRKSYVVKDNLDKIIWECHVERLTDDGVEEVASLGMHTVYAGFNSEDGNKFYFVAFAEKENGDNNPLEITLKSFNKETGEVEDLAELKCEDFGYENQGPSVKQATDDYCVVGFLESDGSVKEYTYTYENGDINELYEEENEEEKGEEVTVIE